MSVDITYIDIHYVKRINRLHKGGGLNEKSI